ncbi:hypothetical protein DP64_05845 [Stutzerimonas degradans]|nr:hypothetical protein DP64_05845 [Stutzerimonas degradans]
MEIRESTLLAFFKKAGRYTKCPFCPHDGAWAFHLAEARSDTNDHDPLMEIHKIGASSAIAMSCPNCGHLSMISTMVITGELAEAINNG